MRITVRIIMHLVGFNFAVIMALVATVILIPILILYTIASIIVFLSKHTADGLSGLMDSVQEAAEWGIEKNRKLNIRNTK